MCDTIAHRGPDEPGYRVTPTHALGMRRLSIIDLSGGTQPIANEDENVHVVFNGEIYNFRELRQRLARNGHRFRTTSDTEVLVHLYEEDGDGLMHRLRGMFAFAIWDERRERLLLARDRLGIKPLYYGVRDGGVFFGSELKSLRSSGWIAGELEPSAVSAYLALGYVPDPQSIYRGIYKLPPGHLLTWTRGEGVQVRRYWTPPATEDPTIDEEAAKSEIRRLLDEAVGYRLIADVPLGAFLSGGLDSSAVVATMSRLMDRPVETFSIGFGEAEYNEAPDAAAVAAALGTTHHELVVTPNVEELMHDIALAFDEPFADSSAIPTYLVSKLAAQHVKVVLSGDGGDELFGGYSRYLDYGRRAVSLPNPIRRALTAVGRSLPQGALGRNRLLELGRDEIGRYMGMVADPLRVVEGGLANQWFAAAGGEWTTPLLSPFREAANRDPLGRLMHVDLLTYLPGDILTKVDRMSMAASLEARVPLLDHHLVEFAARIPTRLKIRAGTGKWVFREAVRDRVPEVVFPKRKQGFAVPLRPWFRGPLQQQVESLASSDLQEWIDPAALKRVTVEHRRGRRDHSGILWKLLVLKFWSEAERQRVAVSPAGMSV